MPYTLTIRMAEAIWESIVYIGIRIIDNCNTKSIISLNFRHDLQLNTEKLTGHRW